MEREPQLSFKDELERLSLFEAEEGDARKQAGGPARSPP